MAIKVNIQTYGLKELDQLFSAMPLDFQDKVLKEVHKRAMKPALDRASSLAPVQNSAERAYKTRFNSGGVRTIPLKGSIKAVSGGSPAKTGDVGVVRGGALRRKPYRAFHAGLVEFGSKPGGRPPGGWYKKQGGKKKTVMPRKPFMEPAWAQTKDAVLRSITGITAQRVSARIARYVKRSYR